jgi:hypothetical protein
MSKEVAYRIRNIETMPEVWESLDAIHDNPRQFTNELMLEI